MNRTIEQAAHLFRVHPDLQTSIVREQCQFLASYLGPMQHTSIRLDSNQACWTIARLREPRCTRGLHTKRVGLQRHRQEQLQRSGDQIERHSYPGECLCSHICDVASQLHHHQVATTIPTCTALPCCLIQLCASAMTCSATAFIKATYCPFDYVNMLKHCSSYELVIGFICRT